MNPIPAHISSQFDALKQFGINSKLRLCHFLSQVAHESGHFKHTVENLNYSDVKRIALIFKGDVDTDDDRVVEPHEIEFAKKYVSNPQSLANFVYANQNGNGPEASGDGWNFRGRGYLQLTGRENYMAFDKFVPDDIVANPDLVATKFPLISAAWFFQAKAINTISDLGTSDAAIVAVTKKVNGGTIGLADRISLFRAIYPQLK
jgi:putative chitinase